MDAMIPLGSHADAIDLLLAEIRQTSGYFLAAVLELRTG